jgi:hypothetical protein
MASQLFNHPEAHRLLRCVVENVQPDKTADKLAVIRLSVVVPDFASTQTKPKGGSTYDERARRKSFIATTIFTGCHPGWEWFN